MAKLTPKARAGMPLKDFALSKGRYPIPDPSHARNALSRIAEFGTAAQKSTVKAKVAAKFPGIKQKP